MREVQERRYVGEYPEAEVGERVGERWKIGLGEGGKRKKNMKENKMRQEK
jgi:hypothetical protein